MEGAGQEIGMPDRVPEETQEFLSKVAWLYYANDMTQAEIADQLGTTRLRINRAISSARRAGIVRIAIESPFVACLELQQALVQRYGLEAAYVVPADRERYDYHRGAGAALATYLNQGLAAGEWSCIGVSWGMTLEAAIRGLTPGDHGNIEVVSMLGGTAEGSSFHAFAVAANLSRAIGATYSLLPAPIYMESEEMAARLVASQQFHEHADKIRRVDLAVLVAGDVSDRSLVMRHGLAPDVTMADLVAAGAVGDVLGRFLDKDGREIDHSINRRVSSITLDTLKSLKKVVLAAAGGHKKGIINAILRAGYARTLITDDVTAEALVGSR
jgi:DNA-binding transcriptional regulator LsrR (DeoR family)